MLRGLAWCHDKGQPEGKRNSGRYPNRATATCGASSWSARYLPCAERSSLGYAASGAATVQGCRGCPCQQNGPPRLGSVDDWSDLSICSICGSLRGACRLRGYVSALRNCRGDDDIDAKRSRPSIGKTRSRATRGKNACFWLGPDPRITSGPAATAAAFEGRIHGCTRPAR